MNMSTKKTRKKKTQNTSPAWQTIARKVIAGLKKAFRNQEDMDTADMDMTQRENIRFLMGALLCLVSCFILLSLVSHLFTGDEDQILLTTPDAIAANWMGNWGAALARHITDEWFGIASIFIPLFMLAASVRVMRISDLRLHKWFLNCMLLMIWWSAFLAYASSLVPFMGKSYVSWGGQVGIQETEFIRTKIGTPGLLMIFLLSFIAYLGYLSDEALKSIRQMIRVKPQAVNKESDNETGSEEQESAQDTSNEKEDDDQATDATDEAVAAASNDDATTPTAEEETGEGKVIVFEDTTAPDLNTDNLKTDEVTFEVVAEDPAQTDDATEKAKEESEIKMKVLKGKEPEPANVEPDQALEPYDPKLDLSHYKYPTLDLLKKYDVENKSLDMEEQKKNKDQILSVLGNFGVSITSIKATVGPTITLYEVTPAPGVRISKIRNLEDDIALSLSALGIRIIAPIPGKGTIGIEVPNAKPQMVPMESILNSRKYQETDYELPLALGKTITNEVFMVDLCKMPHLLVAGATGMGKSVGLNVILTSLLYKKHPAELKLVMVDPKKVEFSIYAPIVNHFLAQVEGNEYDEPIITDVNKVVQTLKSLCSEMDSRYDLLKKARCRNIKEYNEMFKNRRLNPENGHRFMPYIVVIIDEFGDLIMTAGKEIELPIARIAQLARAVGIHMIIATQRPTTNIITGTIKANFPARMAFKVSAMIDSRTILDRPGANQLAVKGDMLFLSSGEPVRVQCAFIDTPEVENICNHVACQQSYLGPYQLPLVEMEGGEGEANDVDMSRLDPMFEEVARMVVAEQCGSTSMIQRKFSIGYNRAGRLMDQLEKAGIVGPAKGSKPREVLCISDDDLQYKLSNLR